MGIPEHLTCFLGNMYAGQETTVRTGHEKKKGTGHGTTDWFQIEKRSTLRLYIVTLLIKLLCRVHHGKHWADEAQAGIKIAGRNINNLIYADDTTLMAESKEELNSLLMKVKEENEKVGLKLNSQKAKIMTSGPITSWEIDGETGSSYRLYFGGLQNHCRW